MDGTEATAVVCEELSSYLVVSREKLPEMDGLIG